MDVLEWILVLQVTSTIIDIIYRVVKMLYFEPRKIEKKRKVKEK